MGVTGSAAPSPSLSDTARRGAMTEATAGTFGFPGTI